MGMIYGISENDDVVIQSGIITFGDGVSVTFKKPFDTMPTVVLTPLQSVTSLNNYWVSSTTLTGFTYGGNVTELAWVAVADDSD